MEFERDIHPLHNKSTDLCIAKSLLIQPLTLTEFSICTNMLNKIIHYCMSYCSLRCKENARKTWMAKWKLQMVTGHRRDIKQLSVDTIREMVIKSLMEAH